MGIPVIITMNTYGSVNYKLRLCQLCIEGW